MRRRGLPPAEVIDAAMTAGAALVYMPGRGWFLEPAPELLHLVDDDEPTATRRSAPALARTP